MVAQAQLIRTAHVHSYRLFLLQLSEWQEIANTRYLYILKYKIIIAANINIVSTLC